MSLYPIELQLRYQADIYQTKSVSYSTEGLFIKLQAPLERFSSPGVYVMKGFELVSLNFLCQFPPLSRNRMENLSWLKKKKRACEPI